MTDDTATRAHIQEHWGRLRARRHRARAHETQYFADPFEPAPDRAALAERIEH